MNTMQRFIHTACFLLLGLGFAQGQSSIKLSQQPTTFLYAQLNLHAGISNPGTGLQFGLPGRGSSNQLSLQLMKVHQPQLQKGYTPLVALDSWKVRTNLSYSQSTSFFETTQVLPNGGGQGPRPGPGGPEVVTVTGTTTNSHLNLNLQDAWLKFRTKWDRTSFKVGYGAISYGHHPEVDANNSFMTNIVNTDLGFSRDLGMFVKTPVGRDLDLEVGLSTGGAINSTLFQSNQTGEELENVEGPSGRWLLAGRIGQPSFKKDELGLLLAVGNISTNFGNSDQAQIRRIGAEWIHKSKEQLRVINQFTVGKTETESEGSFLSFALQNNVDLFLSPSWILGLSNALSVHNSLEEGENYLSSTLAGSLTYALSPNTRIRLNQFVTARDFEGGNNWGVSVQFIVGLGKR